MKQNNIKKAEEITNKFFKKIGGRLVHSNRIKVKTYSLKNTKIFCINYYIDFNNQNLFGNGNFSDEIYPRYRKLRKDWRNLLEKYGIKLYSNIAVGFIPLLNNKKESNKFKYKKEKIKPLGAKILNIDKMNSDYLRKMSKSFGVKFALEEKNGALIGPEGGMLYVLEVINKVLGKIDNFIDIGAGTGELSSYVLRSCNPRNIIVNELSVDLKKHLVNYLKKENKRKIKITFNFKDCRNIKFPVKASLISVGVFYGDQPSFIMRKGPEMVRCLGKKGLLMIQSAMPETLFNQHILLGDVEGVNKWPWHSERFILSNYFSCVKVFFIDNQFITLASQSHDLVNKIIYDLDDRAIPYSRFISISNKN